MSLSDPWSRRNVLTGAALSVCVSVAPAVLRAQTPLTLDFLTIADPDGWHPSLRLKGDWLVLEIPDGVHAGYGETSHSRDDVGCREASAY